MKSKKCIYGARKAKMAPTKWPIQNTQYTTQKLTHESSNLLAYSIVDEIFLWDCTPDILEQLLTCTCMH